MRSSRRALALALAALLALAGAGCGADDDGGAAAGDLVWDEQPTVITPPNLPRDRIMGGVVRNDSLRRVDISADDLRVVDADGEAVEASAVFLDTYAHQLFPPTREPRGGIPEQELLRLGVKAKIEPGKTAPLTISWRQSAGSEEPVRVDTGSGSLPIP